MRTWRSTTPELIQISHIGGLCMSDPPLLGESRRIRVESGTICVLDPEAEHKTSTLANMRMQNTQNMPFSSNLVCPAVSLYVLPQLLSPGYCPGIVQGLSARFK